MRPAHLFLLVLLALSYSSSLFSLAASHSLDTVNVHIPNLISGSVSRAVSALCAHTTYKAACASTAARYANTGHHAIDARSMITLHVRRATDGARAAKAELARIMRSLPPTMDSLEKGAYKVCRSEFDDLLDALARGLKAVEQHDLDTASTMLSGVITGCSTCDDAFSDALMTNTIAKYTRSVTKMTSNALAMLRLLRSRTSGSGV